MDFLIPLRLAGQRGRAHRRLARRGRLFERIGIGEESVLRIVQTQEFAPDRNAQRRRGRRLGKSRLESDGGKTGAVGKGSVSLQLIGSTDARDENSLERIDD